MLLLVQPLASPQDPLEVILICIKEDEEREGEKVTMRRRDRGKKGEGEGEGEGERDVVYLERRVLKMREGGKGRERDLWHSLTQFGCCLEQSQS